MTLVLQGVDRKDPVESFELQDDETPQVGDLLHLGPRKAGEVLAVHRFYSKAEGKWWECSVNIIAKRVIV